MGAAMGNDRPRFQRWLLGARTAETAGALFDRHVLAAVLTVAYGDPWAALDMGMGLSRGQLAALVVRHFPHAASELLARVSDGDGAAPLNDGEEALRALLLARRGGEALEQVWLAHILARRAQEGRRLWQDMGLEGRSELTAVMTRHFRPLRLLNTSDLPWKTFFNRALCQGLEEDGRRRCRASSGLSLRR
ncbi:NifQ [mine drainage metagenome]|uniref:NifQ n=1 Tax=mine drainage metagenome TaxID=410659 RepID=A0A1J5R4E9_9ZZZZ